ncbi:right-handed parallel beta-helix repeat-containing protein, partial [Candidatus Woesearchaeota archaeon]
MTTAMYTKGELGTLALFTTLVIALIGSAIFFGPSITGFATLGNNNCSAILNISNEQYNLTQDLTCTNANPALTINASGITLDCKGWSIKEADLAINLTSYASSTTIRNCIISNTDTFTPNTAAINIASGASLTIQDTTIQGTGYATGILSNATAAVVAENITITLPNGVAAINLTNPNTAGNKIINSTFNKGIYLNNVTIDLIGNTLSTGALLALHLFGNNINATQNTFSSSAQPSIITYNPQSSNVFFYNNRITTGTINLTSVTGLSLCVNNIGNNYTNPSLQAVELTPSVECDVTPPNGTLDSPILVSADTDFFYTPTDQSNVYSGASIASCTLYVWSNTGALITTLTNTTISEGVQNNFTNVSLNEGNYIWNVQCTDDYLFPNIGFIATNQSFIYDATPPQAPILYPQILVKGSKNTNDTTTTIAGYFENDPMVNVTVVVLNQSSDFTFNVTTNVSNQTSNTVLNTEVVTYAAAVNDTVVFLNWSAAVENALNNANNRYLEFSNHNKTYFTRYNVTQVNRTGNEIRVVIDPGLEVAISPGVQVSIFDAPFPNGYFRFDDVDLYVGNNSISAWGTDKAGNAGLAAQDWIVRTANSQGTANPASPILEDLNTSYFNITSLQIYGYVLDNSPDLQVFIFSENSEGSRKQTVVNSSATTANFSSTSTPLTTTQVTIAATKGDTLIRFKETDYDAGLNNATYAGKYIEFSGHNTTHFKRYNITSIINPVGQDPYFVTYPPLESNVSIGETVTIYNEEVPNRWFNATLPIWAGTNTIYAVAKNAQGENTSRNLTTTITLPTDSLEITFVNDFGDLTNSKNLSATWTNLSSNPDFTYYEYRIEESDGTVIIDWTPTTNNSANVTINATTQTIYYWKVRAYDSFGLVGNIASSDGILYIDPTPPVALFVLDDGTWQQTKTTFHATWQFEDNESDIILYEYSIGTAQYPDPGFESIVNRTKTTLTDITQSVTLDEGKQYYVNVRAQNGNANYNGSWSNWASSDGIIIDSLPFTGGSLSYFDGDYTASTVTVTYDVGYDQN